MAQLVQLSNCLTSSSMLIMTPLVPLAPLAYILKYGTFTTTFLMQNIVYCCYRQNSRKYQGFVSLSVSHGPECDSLQSVSEPPAAALWLLSRDFSRNRSREGNLEPAGTCEAEGRKTRRSNLQNKTGSKHQTRTQYSRDNIPVRFHLLICFKL